MSNNKYIKVLVVVALVVIPGSVIAAASAMAIKHFKNRGLKNERAREEEEGS